MLLLASGTMAGYIDINTHQITIKKQPAKDHNAINNLMIKIAWCMFGEWPPSFIYRPGSDLHHFVHDCLQHATDLTGLTLNDINGTVGINYYGDYPVLWKANFSLKTLTRKLS